jgi:hypothetical protein
MTNRWGLCLFLSVCMVRQESVSRYQNSRCLYTRQEGGFVPGGGDGRGILYSEARCAEDCDCGGASEAVDCGCGWESVHSAVLRPQQQLRTHACQRSPRRCRFLAHSKTTVLSSSSSSSSSASPLSIFSPPHSPSSPSKSTCSLSSPKLYVRDGPWEECRLSSSSSSASPLSIPSPPLSPSSSSKSISSLSSSPSSSSHHASRLMRELVS